MVLARFVPIVFTLAIAGALIRKRVAPAGLGTMRTDTGTFAGLLVFTVVLIGALTFFPALLLGPAVQGLTDKNLISSFLAVIVFTVLLGIAYPLLITGISQVVFPGRADGSQIRANGKIVGSKLLASDFTEPVPGKKDETATEPEVLPAAAVGHRLEPQRDVLREPGPQPGQRAVLLP